MIGQILSVIPYVKNLQEKCKKLEYTANTRLSENSELHQKNITLQKEVETLKEEIKNLTKKAIEKEEIVQMRIDKYTKIEYISNKRIEELEKENKDLAKELDYYKKALNKYVNGNSDISLYATLNNKPIK